MYCKTCGHKNPDTSNYCEIDGTHLSPPNLYFKPIGQAQFCPSCGNRAAATHSYCATCGRNLEMYIKVDKEAPRPQIGGEPIKETPQAISLPAFSLNLFKKAILPIIVTFGILLFFSFIFIDSFGKITTEMITEQLGKTDFHYLQEMIETHTGERLPRLEKLVGTTDIIMFANLIDANFKIAAKGDVAGKMVQLTGDLGLENGALLYFAVTFLALFVGGIVMGMVIRTSKTKLNRFYGAMAFSILYGGILAIISQFSGFSYINRFNKMELLDLTVTIENQYSFFSTLIGGVFLGFFISSLGILFTINFKRITGNLRNFSEYGEAVHQAFSTIFRGSLLSFVAIFSLLLVLISRVKEGFHALLGYYSIPSGTIVENFFLSTTTAAVQISHYVWNLLHFAPLTISYGTGKIEGSLIYTVFNGFSADGMLGDVGFYVLKSLFTETSIDVYLKIALVIPIALFIWAGYRIAENPDRLLVKIIVFSFLYSFLMCVLALMSYSGFSFALNGLSHTNPEIFVHIGFPALKLFFTSLIFSFALSYTGTWLRQLHPKKPGS